MQKWLDRAASFPTNYPIDRMAVQISSSSNINDVLCADPMYGCVSEMLMNGGSWFEADQMYWRLRQQHVCSELKKLLENRATKSAITSAEELLQELQECSKQLLYNIAENGKLFARAEELVKSWAPEKKTVAVVVKRVSKNNFTLLDDSEEE